MGSSELKKYPRGQIGVGSGDLQQCTSVEVTKTNNAKVLHTLRRNGAGVVKGNVAVAFSGETVIDEDGPERDYFDLVDNGEAQNVRIKLPGAVTKTIIGVISEAKVRLTLEEGVLYSFSGVGSQSKS